MSPFLTWLLSILGPVLVEALKDWLRDLIVKSAPAGLDSLSRPAQVVRAFAAAIDRHAVEGDRLRKERADLHWYELGAWWSLNRKIRQHDRRGALLPRIRDVLHRVAREERSKLDDDEATEIAIAAEIAS